MMWLLAVLTLFVAHHARHSDVADLPNGYQAIYTDSRNRSIARDHELVIPPHVAALVASGRWVIGLRQVSEYPLFQDVPQFNTGFGYFLLDTETGETVTGLTWEALLDACAGRAIPDAVCRSLPDAE